MTDELTPHQKGREIAKFREKFRHEKIYELTKNDFEDFLKACPKLFATRSGSRPDARHEDMHGGQVTKSTDEFGNKKNNFPELKKALKVLVDEKRPLQERFEEIFAKNNTVWSGRTPDMYSRTLTVRLLPQTGSARISAD